MYEISELSHDDTLDISVFYEGICTSLSSIVDTTNFFIARLNSARQELEFVYFRDTAGLLDDLTGEPPARPLGRGFTELVLDSGRPTLLTGEDIRQLCLRGERVANKLNATSWLGVPLITSDEVFGAIVIQSYTEQVQFDESDVNLLTFVSNNISHAIKRHEEKMARQRDLQKLALASQRDTLTGLLNRTTFHSELEKACTQLLENHFIAVLFIDLDGFKMVNDTYGHAEGDKVLKTVAKLLKAEVRACDAVSRMGGDEFVVMLPDIESANQATEVAKRMLEAISEYQCSNNLTVELGASIGIAVSERNKASAKELINKADAAMYDIKRQGKNNFSIEAI
nr:sensor domain-containing diguanylate cyclase [Alteromonas ponticola]